MVHADNARNEAVAHLRVRKIVCAREQTQVHVCTRMHACTRIWGKQEHACWG